MAIPSLLDLCIQAAASSVFWTVQCRSLERLPEHAANQLLELLLLRQSPLLGKRVTTAAAAAEAPATASGGKGGKVVARGGDGGSPAGVAAGGGASPLRPATLELFRHCVTRVTLRGPAVTVEWLAALAGFSHLDTLQLTGCTKLTATALQPLIFTSSPPPASGPTLTPTPTPAAACLRHLDVSGCSRLGDEALPALASLTSLLSLNITETGVGGPGLVVLSSLRGLTRLQAGGLKAVGDEAWMSLLSHLPVLSHLDLWGSDAGGGTCGGEQLLVLLAAGLPLLRHLGVAWTKLGTVPALPELEVLDMRHCRLREVWWPAGQPSRLALRLLLLRGAVLSGPLTAAAAEDPNSPAGLACVVRHSAATLEHLDLSEVGCADPWVAPLAALDTNGGGATAPRLTYLDLSRTLVRAEDLAYLQCAPSLEKLVAADCRAAGSTPGAAALAAAGLPQLKDLNLSSCSMTDSAVSWLQQLTALTNLNLAANTDLTLGPTMDPTRTPEPIPRPTLLQLQPPLQPQPPPPPALPDPALPVDVWAAVPDAPPGRGRGGGGGGGGDLAPEPLGPTPQDVAVAAAPEAVADAATAGAAAAAGSSSSNMRRDGEGGRAGCCSSTARSSSGTGGDGDDGGGAVVWPRLRRLNLLGTRVSEAGLRALLIGSSGNSGGGSLRLLEQLKAGGPGLTDGAIAVLAAGELPGLHSLLLRDAPLTGHGSLLLAAGLPSLRRLELQACWLVSEQDATRLAATCGPGALVVVNGKAAAATTSRVTTAMVSSSSPPSASKGGAAATTTAAGSQRGRGAAGGSTASVAALSGDYLSYFDQRLRYDNRTLLRLAASPLVTGGAGSGGIGDGEQGGRGISGDGWGPLWADLPASMRR